MNSKSKARVFLPATADEMRGSGPHNLDVIIVTGDAYVDHPSFGAALVGRYLESLGLEVGIIAQPDWSRTESFRVLGRPRLFFGVTAGNLDSRLAGRTAQRKVRNDDAYSPGGVPRMRPDLPTIVYAHRIRQAYPGVPIVLGGIEASLRRFAHYDFWSDSVRQPLLLDSKADLLVFGMAELQLGMLVEALGAGRKIGEIRDIPGTEFPLGASEVPSGFPPGFVELPPFEEVAANPGAFAEMTAAIHMHARRPSGPPLAQRSGTRAVVANPPAPPIDGRTLDGLYDLPFTRMEHPSCRGRVPALEMIKDSVTIHRGCFGGCSFCSLALHQGPAISSRSPASIRREIEAIASAEGFSGMISDIGGPTANMYGMGCSDPSAGEKCRRPSCLYPRICAKLNADHAPLMDLMRSLAGIRGVKKVLVNSGVRMDLALESRDYIRLLAAEHTGGLLSVAPEHTEDTVLDAMGKPAFSVYEEFEEEFQSACAAAGRKQHLSLYIMAGHPGCTMEHAKAMARRLKAAGLAPRQVQEFIPVPLTVSTCMYHSGLNPFGMKPVYASKKLSEKRAQKEMIFRASRKIRGF